jgi:hypothetical protein
MLRPSSTKANARAIFTPARGIFLSSALKLDVNKNKKITKVLDYYKNGKFKKRRFLSRKFVFMRANDQGYVCYHRLLFNQNTSK